MTDLGTEQKAREFLIDTYILSQAGSVPNIAAIYPPLREYVKQYRRTPELLVTLYDFAGGVPEEEGADEWLRQAHRMEPENQYVLWQRFLSRGTPWFPSELIYSNDILAEQKWLLAKLMDRDPQDPLAWGVQSYLNKTQRPLGVSTIIEDLEFLNNLNWVAPHPWRQLGLITMLHSANDPRYIRRRFPSLARD